MESTAVGNYPLDREEDFLNAIVLSVLINDYAFEDISMGHSRPKELLPYDRYVEELALQRFNPYRVKPVIEKVAMDQDYIILDQPVAFFQRQFFCNAFNDLLMEFPIGKKRNRKYDYLLLKEFKYGVKEYIESLFPLFCAIADTQVQYDPYDIIPQFTDRQTYEKQKNILIKFLIAVKVKGLRQGCTVDRYVKNMQMANKFIMRIVKYQNGHFRLINSDPSSMDFQLAMLSTIQFMKQSNDKLFELKSEAWERSSKT